MTNDSLSDIFLPTSGLIGHSLGFQRNFRPDRIPLICSDDSSENPVVRILIVLKDDSTKYRLQRTRLA